MSASVSADKARRMMLDASDPFIRKGIAEVEKVLSGVPGLPDPIPNMKLADLKELMLISWWRGNSAARES